MKIRISDKINRDENLYTIYSSEAGFFKAIDEVEEITERIEAPLIGLRIYDTQSKTIEEIVSEFGFSQEEARKIKGSPFVINVNGEYMPVRESSLISIGDRFKIYGKSLSKLSNANLAEVLNIAREVVNKNEHGLVVKIGNKISAVLSDGYRVIFADQIFKIAKKSVSKLAGCFKKGLICHDIMSCEYELRSTKLIRKYASVINDGYEEGFKLSVAFATSNIGYSAVNAYPIYTKVSKGRECSYIMGKPISVEHRGNADIDKVAEAFEGIFPMFEHSIEKIIELKKIKIEHPQQAFLNAAKSINLNKKYALLAYKDFLELGLEEANAYDIYAGLAEAVFYAKEDGKDEINLANMREIVARALTINWKSVDLPFSSWLKVEVIKSASNDGDEEQLSIDQRIA